MLLGTMPSRGPRRRHGHLPQVGANSTYGLELMGLLLLVGRGGLHHRRTCRRRGHQLAGGKQDIGARHGRWRRQLQLRSRRLDQSHAGVTRWQRGAADGHNGNKSNTPNRAVSYCPKSDISNPLLCIFCEIFLSVFHEKAQINVILQHTNSIKK